MSGAKGGLMWLDEWIFIERTTVTAVAKKLDVSRSHISSIISGRRRASPDLAQHIEKLTKGKVTIKEILFGHKSKRKKVEDGT